MDSVAKKSSDISMFYCGKFRGHLTGTFPRDRYWGGERAL